MLLLLLFVIFRGVQVQFGRLLREQAASQDQFMAGMQKSFVEPMEAYTREEHGKLANSKKTWVATEEAYVAVRFFFLAFCDVK